MKDWKLGATIAIVIARVSALCRFLYQNLNDFLQITVMQALGIRSIFFFLEKTKMIFINLLTTLNVMLETMRPSYLVEKDDQESNMNLVWKLSWPFQHKNNA